MKVYVVGGDVGYLRWLNAKPFHGIYGSDLVMFTGGEDVCPETYHKKCHPLTHYNHTRDYWEKEAFQYALMYKKPMVGICRGSQFLCAMAGGILVQHQSHPYLHEIETYDGKRLTVTSTHHQRQFPWGVDHKLLGWCNLSPFSEGEDETEIMTHNPPLGKNENALDCNYDPDDHLPEVEVAYYQKINALAIQPHPEMMGFDSPACVWLREQLEKMMAGVL